MGSSFQRSTIPHVIRVGIERDTIGVSNVGDEPSPWHFGSPQTDRIALELFPTDLWVFEQSHCVSHPFSCQFRFPHGVCGACLFALAYAVLAAANILIAFAGGGPPRVTRTSSYAKRKCGPSPSVGVPDELFFYGRSFWPITLSSMERHTELADVHVVGPLRKWKAIRRGRV